MGHLNNFGVWTSLHFIHTETTRLSTAWSYFTFFAAFAWGIETWRVFLVLAVLSSVPVFALWITKGLVSSRTLWNLSLNLANMNFGIPKVTITIVVFRIGSDCLWFWPLVHYPSQLWYSTAVFDLAGKISCRHDYKEKILFTEIIKISTQHPEYYLLWPSHFGMPYLLPHGHHKTIGCIPTEAAVSSPTATLVSLQFTVNSRLKVFESTLIYQQFPK